MLARVRHPNLLLFMGYTTRPEPCIVLEFMPRGSLYTIMRQSAGRAADVKLARAVALSVARGMAYLHSRTPPILHLDLKSPNILVDDRWRIKISGARRAAWLAGALAGALARWLAGWRHAHTCTCTGSYVSCCGRRASRGGAARTQQRA